MQLISLTLYTCVYIYIYIYPFLCNFPFNTCLQDLRCNLSITRKMVSQIRMMGWITGILNTRPSNFDEKFSPPYVRRRENSCGSFSRIWDLSYVRTYIRYKYAIKLIINTYILKNIYMYYLYASVCLFINNGILG